MLKVRQELYLEHQICKKAQQDVGLFYCLKFSLHNVHYVNFRKIKVVIP